MENLKIWSKKLLDGIVWLISAAIGIYFFKYLIIPIAIVCFSFYVMYKLIKNKNGNIVTAIAIQTGHLIWAIASCILVYFAYNQSPILMDILLLVIWVLGVFWLYFKPGIASIGCLIIYHIILLFYNISNLINLINTSNTNDNMASIAGLIMHIALRISAIIFMFIGYRQSKEIKSNNIVNNELEDISIPISEEIDMQPEITLENIPVINYATDIKSRLETLEELKSKNIITYKEYVNKRNEIINNI